MYFAYTDPYRVLQCGRFTQTNWRHIKEGYLTSNLGKICSSNFILVLNLSLSQNTSATSGISLQIHLCNDAQTNKLHSRDTQSASIYLA